MSVATPPSDDPSKDQISWLLAAAKAEPETPIPLDRAEAERFIVLLTGDPEAPVRVELDWATFTDDKKKRRKPERFRGTLESCWLKLARYNAKGCGCFITINESNGQSFEDKDIIRARALFVDDDREDPITHEALAAAGLAPSMSVVSGGGTHHYWLLRATDGDTLEKFSQVQKALAVKFGTDPKIHNRGRVMRLPGTIHAKPDDTTGIVDPFLVYISHG